ncbi:MAG: NAD(P)H-dependent oxidoreductase subunit E [bacterium]
MANVNVDSIIKNHKNNGNGIISILQDIQSKYSYLPQEALMQVAKETNKSLVDIYGVATFYKSFTFEPKGKHHITVCLGTACHVRGGQTIAEHVQKHLGIAPGKTTPDKKFSYETVTCLGACALGPVVVCDGHYISKVKTTDIKKILYDAEIGFTKDTTISQESFSLNVSCKACNHDLMDPEVLIDGQPSIRLTASFKRRHGSLWLSPIYGSHNIKSEHKIPEDYIVNIFCPHCHVELTHGLNCPDCGETMVPMKVKDGGIIQICPKKGCPGHLLDLEFNK